MILPIFIFLAGLLSFGSAQSPCCFPKQFEAVVGIIGGYITPLQEIKAINSFTKMSYDFINKKQAMEIHHRIPTPTVFKQIMDYAAGKTYFISGQSCTVNTLTGPMIEDCIPGKYNEFSKYLTYTAIEYGNSTYLGRAFFGPEGKRLNYDAWEYHWKEGNLNVKVTVTTDTCVPIWNALYGFVNNVNIAESLSFSGLTDGIKDPNVFVPPPSCRNETVIVPPFAQEFKDHVPHMHHLFKF